MSTDVINIDPEILGGTLVSKGTRVPVESLFACLERGVSIDEFLEDFPAVSCEQVTVSLETMRGATGSIDSKTMGSKT